MPARKFAHYLLARHADRDRSYGQERARLLIEETQLFIEAAYACHTRLLEKGPQGRIPSTAATPAAHP